MSFSGRSSSLPLLLTPGFWLLTSDLVTNEARILLMHKDLPKYTGSAAVIGCATASDSWLLTPDFCSDAERSRNVTDGGGLPNLSWDSKGNPTGHVDRRLPASGLSQQHRSNEAGMLLIAEHLRIYLGNSPGGGPGRPREGLRTSFGLGGGPELLAFGIGSAVT
jgi:hypothetical protein